ncbi:hypothetical protein [uncultured Gammaproteobacteria bacterium]|nr:hypothetical protein [uncultured Gammaproteobacteria bacterium]CAC9500876.1 hypothetical protein [uncultured Gammaproteobacteria bacterium]CAC9984183.1 hypothetical protein [uncultured Gammaproteobacteria bacterium]
MLLQFESGVINQQKFALRICIIDQQYWIIIILLNIDRLAKYFFL